MSFRYAFRGPARIFNAAHSRKALACTVAATFGGIAIASESKRSHCAGPEEDELKKYRPNLDEYTRIDSYLHEKPEYASFRENHAMHETLRGDKLIQNYEIYKKQDANEIYCILSYGHALNGYRGVVHGGITALAFDNTFGWLFASSGLPIAMTANLSVNYR